MNKRFGPALVAGLFALVSIAPAFSVEAPDPTKAGPYTAKSGEYRFAPQVDNSVTPFATTEVWARVWYPTNKSGLLPLAVFLHGNHSTCGHMVGSVRVDDKADYSTTGKCPTGYVVTPNHAGYDYIGKLLATQGYLVVSINANRGITAAPEDQRENDPGLILRRGRMILRHLQLLSTWHRNGGAPASVGFNFKSRVDFSKIVIMGHSRGGDGVVAAYNIFKTNSSWRSLIPGAKFLAVAPLAPTDFQTAQPNVFGTSLSVLLPMCDGDVSRLSGIGFYDRSISVNPDTDGNFKSVFATWGADHNGYNTEWQVDDNYPSDHTCPLQNKLFHTTGPSAAQQIIGKFYMTALIRGKAENNNYLRLFNPAYTLPAGLKAVARVDRSFFSSMGTTFRRLVRFDGTCGDKLAVTANVTGQCVNMAEHASPRAAAKILWGPPATATANNVDARFSLVGGPFNFNNYQTLDMRVAPDCNRVTVNNVLACNSPTLQASKSTSQQVSVFLEDGAGNVSKNVSLTSYIDARPAVGVSVPGNVLPVNPLYHAIFSSARIPITAFSTPGFSLTAVKFIWINVDNIDSGGLYFGDVSLIGLANNAVRQVYQAPDASDATLTAGEGALASAMRNVQLTPGVNADESAVAVPQQSGVAASDGGSRVLLMARSSLGAHAGQAPDASLVVSGRPPSIELTISTSKQIIEGDSLPTVIIGGRRVEARRYLTGHETETPSVTKLVIPAEAVDAAADGAALSVATPGQTFQFGGLNKSAIR
jgi:hypothetical protein